MRPPSRGLTVMLFVVAAGILIQAVLAGVFISGVANLRLAHAIVGSALLWIGLAPGIIALASRAASRLPGTVRVGSVLLTIGLWVQNALGHMPFATSTALHVPLGTVLSTGAFALAIGSLRPARTAVAEDGGASPPPPPPASTTGGR